MHKDLTIREIANLANVSVSTVSRVINNQPNVSEEKRKRIEKIISKYDYHPNMLARSMISRKTNLIGVVVPDLNNPYFISLISQIDLFARKMGYQIILVNSMTAGKFSSKNRPESEIKVIEDLEKYRVDGLIILGGEIDQEKINATYADRLNRLAKRLPVVIIGQPDNKIHVTFVTRFQSESARIITQHLLALGHKKIGFIGGQPGIKVTQQRMTGYLETMRIYSKVDKSIIINNDFYISNGYDAVQKLIKEKKLPHALICVNDQVAQGAIRALTDNHLTIPDHVAIASCDLFPSTDYFVPRITTVNHHNDQLAQIAISYLKNLINKEKMEKITVPHPTLVIRESCGAKQNE